MEQERWSAPRTPDEMKLLNAHRPLAWEYLLFAGVLAQGKEALEPRWRDYEVGYVRPTGNSVDDLEAWGFIAASMNDAQIYIGNITRVLSPEAQLPAFGPAGQPGDPALIEHMAKRVISSYEDLLDRASRIRGTRTSDMFRQLFELSAVFTDKPLHQMRDFIDDTVDKIERIPQTIKEAKGERATLTLDLVVNLDDAVEKAFHAEAERVRIALGIPKP